MCGMINSTNTITGRENSKKHSKFSVGDLMLQILLMDMIMSRQGWRILNIPEDQWMFIGWEVEYSGNWTGKKKERKKKKDFAVQN